MVFPAMDLVLATIKSQVTGMVLIAVSAKPATSVKIVTSPALVLNSALLAGALVNAEPARTVKVCASAIPAMSLLLVASIATLLLSAQTATRNATATSTRQISLALDTASVSTELLEMELALATPAGARGTALYNVPVKVAPVTVGATMVSSVMQPANANPDGVFLIAPDACTTPPVLTVTFSVQQT